MKLNSILFFITFYLISTFGFSQNVTIKWQGTIGGNNNDKLTGVQQTYDGGMILAGYSNSNISGNKAQNSYKGSYDYWIVKLDKNGNTQWSRTIGGTDRDLAPTVIQSTDSGYVIGGRSISPASDDKSENAINQSFDYWVVKLNKNGNKVWDNTIGGIQLERLATILETPGGYYLCGSSHSTYGYDKTVPNEGSSLWADYWVVKINKNGTVLWDSTYGSKNKDELTCAKVTLDKGLILGGYSYSPAFDEKSQDFDGNGDYWLLKTDSLGRKQWDATIGGSLSDYLTSLDVTNDGYILGGYSNSPASFNKSKNCKGVTDFWIVKTDKYGNVKWDKTIGGSGEDDCTSVQFFGGQYIVGGYSNSPKSGDKTSPGSGGMDYWVMALDKDGNILQQKTIGGTGDDYLQSFIETSSNNYIVGGYSNSPKSGAKNAGTVGNTGMFDYWVLKLGTKTASAQLNEIQQPIVSDAEANIITRLSLSVTPNPVKDNFTITYNGAATNAQLIIYNNSGKVISQQTIQQQKGVYPVNFSNQAAGIYYVVIQSGSSSATQKIIKQ